MKKRLGATFLVIEDMLATSITLPIEMMSAAESAALGRDRKAKRLNIATVGVIKSPIRTRSGFSLTPELTINEIGNSDMVIIPSLWRNPRPIIKRHPEVITWLQQLHEKGAMIIAVGTGACFLAEAGLLNGKAATTHWH